jgi:hypothetical protein
VVEIAWQLRKMAAERQVKLSREKCYALSHSLGLGGAAVVGIFKKHNEIYDEMRSYKDALKEVPFLH